MVRIHVKQRQARIKPIRISQYLMISRRRAANPPVTNPSRPLPTFNSRQFLAKNHSPTHQQKPKEQDREYQTLGIRQDWAQFILAIAYISQLKDKFKTVVEQVDNGSINIQSCSICSIPKLFRQRFNKPKLLQLLKRLTPITQQPNPHHRINQLLTLFQCEPDICFSACLLLRSTLVQTTKQLLLDNNTQYLGNQLDILRDFSCNFEYKLFKIAAISLKMNIEIVYIHEAGEHSEGYSEQGSEATLQLIKRTQRVEFRVAGLGEEGVVGERGTMSTEASAKNAIRNLIGAERTDKGDKTERTDRIERTDRTEKIERTDKNDDRLDKTQRNDKTERARRFERERQQRIERLEREQAQRERVRKEKAEIEQERIEKEKAEKEKAEKDKLEKLEKEKADKELAQKERSERLKQRFEKPERNKSPDLREKSASKACPRCGQLRKPQQKFCVCRKNVGARAAFRPQ